jgi:hypothetical protein
VPDFSELLLATNLFQAHQPLHNHHAAIYLHILTAPQTTNDKHEAILICHRTGSDGGIIIRLRHITHHLDTHHSIYFNFLQRLEEISPRSKEERRKTKAKDASCH